MLRFVMYVWLTVFSAAGVSAADENANIVRWTKGTLEYRNISDGQRSGSEEWRMTVHPDGSRTLTSTNRVDRDGTQRTVVLRVQDNLRPLELYSSFWLEGAWSGSSLITVEGNMLEAVASTPHGRITQRIAVPDNIAFIPHPLQSNAWQLWSYDKSKAGDQTSTVYDLMTRVKGPGNLLGPMYESVTTYIGREQVTVPAGTFEADHYRVASAVDIYVTGPDIILLKFVWAYADQEYVLTSLESGR